MTVTRVNSMEGLGQKSAEQNKFNQEREANNLIH